MKAPARLGLYVAGLVAVFGASFTTAGAVIPQETVQNWVNHTEEHGHDQEESDMDAYGRHGADTPAAKVEVAGHGH